MNEDYKLSLEHDPEYEGYYTIRYLGDLELSTYKVSYDHLMDLKALIELLEEHNKSEVGLVEGIPMPRYDGREEYDG